MAGASETATITSVRTGRTIVNYLGVTTADTSQAMNRSRCRLALTDATTITTTRVGATGTFIVRYEVVEYLPGVLSVQRGSITVNDVTSATATITGVDMRRSYLVYGHHDAENSTSHSRAELSMALTNSTTVTANKNTSTDQSIGSFQVVTI